MPQKKHRPVIAPRSISQQDMARVIARYKIEDAYGLMSAIFAEKAKLEKSKRAENDKRAAAAFKHLKHVADFTGK